MGQNVRIRKRKIVNNEITYTDPEVVKALVEQITGYTEVWERLGIIVDADYRVTFPANTDIDIGDLVEVNNEWCRVTEKIVRKIGNNVNSIECLLRKRE